MNEDLTAAIENLLEMASSKWLSSTCKALRTFPSTATVEFVLQRLAEKGEANRPIPKSLAKQPAVSLQVVGHSEEEALLALGNVMRMASTLMSWKSLSWTLEVGAALHRRWQKTGGKANGRQVMGV